MISRVYQCIGAHTGARVNEVVQILDDTMNEVTRNHIYAGTQYQNVEPTRVLI
jgi:hypothetical protein